MSHAEQVIAYADAGAGFVQLRDKDATSACLLEESRNAAEAAAERGIFLVINDRVDIALMVTANGVHLGQDDLPPEAARRLLGESAVIGLSTHSMVQAERALDQPIDYLAIGPIFETNTKADHEPVVGLRGLESIRRVVGDFPLVAIGGITAERLTSVFNAGASSAAMISGLASDPARITENYRELTRLSGNC
jgi:thiamine-phosphate pyrophosphorylase